MAHGPRPLARRYLRPLYLPSNQAGHSSIRMVEADPGHFGHYHESNGYISGRLYRLELWLLVERHHIQHQRHAESVFAGSVLGVHARRSEAFQAHAEVPLHQAHHLRILLARIRSFNSGLAGSHPR